MAEYLVQGESITAVADAIREKGGTTAPLSFPAGMAEAVRDISSGGTDISLGLTGAAVDQTVKVKAIDASGKPTAWEAVDIAKPWGWELINEITIPEGSDEILEFVINTDSTGKPFKLHRFMMCVYMPIYTGASEIPRFGYGQINGHRYSENTIASPLIYTTPSQPSKTNTNTFSWMEGDIMGDGNHMCLYGAVQTRPDSNGGLRIESGAGGVTATTRLRYITGVPQSLYDVYRPVTSVGLYNILMFAGCKVWLYGTRVQEDET